ncbi:MAG: hypothetical protein EON60_01560 [Alphaproteobacteria bacterium]|nr:MAG: hypothetical protein EON60_01560 [Alphaproteobacteria bacterium]
MTDLALEHMPDEDLEALVASHSGRAQMEKDAITAAQKVLDARKRTQQEAMKISNFIDLLRRNITLEMNKPESERQPKIEFPSGYGDARYLRESDGYRRVIVAIEDKFDVAIDVVHVPGKGQGYWEDDAYAMIEIFFGHRHERDSEEWKAVVERELARIATF